MIKVYTQTAVLLLVAISAGCESGPPEVALVRGIPVASGSGHITYRPQVGPINAVAGVRQAEAVKVYGVNRYVDPGDPRIMHERHAIYRLENQPEWLTRSPRQRGEVILGPVLGLKKPEYAPEPLPGETARELVQARRGLEEANENVHAVAESQAKLADSVESLAKKNTEVQQKLTTVVSYLNDRVKHLEGDTTKPTPETTTTHVEEQPVTAHSTE